MSAKKSGDDTSAQQPAQQPKDGSQAGRPDQGQTHNTGTGAGGATEFGGGVKNHPSRIRTRPPGG